jgi:hypothetical protein
MNKQYECLVIVEGKTDVETYKSYITDTKYKWLSANGKPYLCNWDNNSNNHEPLINEIAHYITLSTLKKVILIVDSDDDPEDSFKLYSRSRQLRYISETPIITFQNNYWFIDEIRSMSKIPVYGVTVPLEDTGCLETELLNTYGYPKPQDKDYIELERIIRLTSDKWEIVKDSNGYEWFDSKNHDARMDKFIYSALRKGFESVGKKPVLPREPKAITKIKEVLSLS